MMADGLIRWSGLGLGALVVIGTGVRLTRTGWPFGMALLTVHKLVALACVIAVAINVYRAFRADSPGLALLALAIASAAFVIGSFASGGVVSAIESAPSWAVWLHRGGTWITVGVVAVCYFMAARSSI